MGRVSGGVLSGEGENIGVPCPRFSRTFRRGCRRCCSRRVIRVSRSCSRRVDLRRSPRIGLRWIACSISASLLRKRRHRTIEKIEEKRDPKCRVSPASRTELPSQRLLHMWTSPSRLRIGRAPRKKTTP
ncbi:uncharacterized protein LOC116414377 [Apis florea]|uniref:uncharacterized protein LOC116414377 n=1 Tax=Apis florea TaxID=7463 RepID=UPI0012FE7FF2|nr:uncharacterized protein LOC116414377 [Apis florea]